MVDPYDPFGQVMLENLKERGCDLLGIEACSSLEAQKERLQNQLSQTSEADKDKNMKVDVEGHTMTTVYNQLLGKADKARIERIEIFDEFEEWDMLQSHYCLCLGKKFQEAV